MADWMSYDDAERFLQIVHYLTDNCDSKRTAHGADICILQTEPCKVAIKRGRCPLLLEHFKQDGERRE